MRGLLVKYGEERGVERKRKGAELVSTTRTKGKVTLLSSFNLI